jgi:Na+:H+ antiporter, NhaA family
MAAMCAPRKHLSRAAGMLAEPSGLALEQGLAVRPTLDFLRTEAAGGAVVVAAALAGVVIANSAWSGDYFAIIGAPVTIQMGAFIETLSVQDWIKDGLMALFFFTVGLQIKQEVLKGEFSSLRKLALPVLAALGGMIVPAAIYLAVDHGAPDAATGGWTVTTPSDLALALAALALIGRGVPESLRLFLMAFVVASNLGAIALTAVLFTNHIHFGALIGAGLSVAGLVLLSEWKDAPLLLRAIGFLILGGFTLKSGVNTAVAAVAAALTVPIGPRRPGQEPVLRDFMQSLHPYVAFGVLPLFAFTAAGIPFAELWPDRLAEPASLAAAAGLFLGKQSGVMAAVFIAVRTGLARRPTGASWLELYGVALLGGIGATMSLFMASLAFAGPDRLTERETAVGVIAGSLASALAGLAVLTIGARRRRQTRGEET